MENRSMKLLPGGLGEKTGYEAVRNAIRPFLYTPGGRKLLERMYPVGNRKELEILTGQTSEMIGLYDRDQALPFVNLREIDIWMEQCRAEGATLPVEAFAAIREHCRLARIVRSACERIGEECPSLRSLSEIISPPEELEREIETCIGEEGEIRDEATSELREIRKQLRSARHSLRKTIEKSYREAVRNGIASDEGPTIRGGRMVIPVRAEFKRKIDGFIHDISSSGQTVYLEPVDALRLNNDIRQLESSEKREIEKILLSLTRLTSGYRDTILRNETLLGELDLIQARTRLGLGWDGIVPVRPADKTWLLREAKNPDLLLKGDHKEEPESIVPLNLELKAEEGGIIISGPNAGGKSVALKTVAAISAMYQSGIPLPLSPESQLPLIGGLFLDMGDEQSIEQDLSTFSSRLDWMRRVAECVDETSLVLVDEAGTGTDPDEGAALFQAFFEYLLERGARLIATTHHGSLKVFAHDHPNLVNAAMEFDSHTLAPTYRFRKGIPGSSYAFEIAERMDLPDRLLDRARNLVGSRKNRLAELLQYLEQQTDQLRNEREEYRRLSADAGRVKEEFLEKSKRFESERQKRLEQTYREADRILQGANRQIERAVERISTTDRSGKEILQARKEVEERKKEVREKLDSAERMRQDPSTETPSVGDTVRVRGSDSSGELLEVEGNRAVVLSGGMRLKTDLRKLEKSKNQPAGPKPAARRQKYRPEPVSPELSLRGMRADEAIHKLMLYLDKAVAAGLHRVDIIHGKGEGILRERVREHLSDRKEVTGFEDAPWDRGGAGCTVVRFD